jgi:arylsulfatase A-like enzyme
MGDEARANGAYERFEGAVGRTFGSSTPWWPPRRTAREGAPNVVVVIADDVGFSDLGCYGSEIATPNLDAIAAGGVRYANFHVMPLCSPTRAALLTGRNSHAAGMGVVANADPGFPGYAGELPANQPSLAETFRANGYSTLAIGKWHLCRDSDMHEAADRDSWPLQRGFDQYYGFLEALTSQHHPHRLLEGNSAVHIDDYPEGYYLTDDLTDRAVRMIREVKTANPAKPFFLYFAHGAVHAPLHAKPEDIARQHGKYAIGWDELRERRLARQKELGIVAEDTVLPARNFEAGEDVAAWDSFSADDQRLFARYMEVYAAMVESIDQSVGRIRAVIEELGEWENTVFLFLSDNGASREGRNAGGASYFYKSPGTLPANREIRAYDRESLDVMGGPTTWPHYPRGWAMACNTPFRLYKVTSFRGGNQVPMVLSWPKGLKQRGEIRRQYQHVTDVLPTLVDLLGLEPVTSRNGLPAHPLAGSSLVPTISDPAAPSTHGEQYTECAGHRAFYRDGWEVVTFREPLKPFRDEHWHLFDMENDPTQINDLAAERPELATELRDAWEQAAWANQVFPLDEGTRLNYLWRPPFDEPLSRPVTIRPGTPTLERLRALRLIANRSFRFVVDWRYEPVDEGILVAHGGQESGYVLYVEDGRLRFVMNAAGEMLALPDVTLEGPSREVTVDVIAPGNETWLVEISVDGAVASTGTVAQMVGYLPFEGIDVGLDRRSPVSWDIYRRRRTFPFTGTINGVTYIPGATAIGAGDEAIARAIEIGMALD